MKECREFSTDGITTKVSLEEIDTKYEVRVELTSPRVDMETIRITRYGDIMLAVGHYKHLTEGLDRLFESFNRNEETRDSDEFIEFLFKRLN